MAAVGTRGPGTLTPEQIAQIRRWAQRVGQNGAERTLRQATQAVVRLADEATRLRGDTGDGWDWDEDPGSHRPLPPEKVAEARAFAGRIAANGAGPELKAAARAITLLCDDLESLTGRRASLPPSRGGRSTEAAAGGRRRPLSPLVIASVVGAVALSLLAFVILRAMAPDLDPQGPSDGQLVGQADLQQLRFSIAGDEGTVEKATWTLDGEELQMTPRLVDGRVVFAPKKLADGRHELEVSMPGVAPWSAAATTWVFTLDTTPPAIELPGDILKATVRTPLSVEGSAGDAVKLTVNGEQVDIDGGRFTLEAPAPPTKPFELVAVDAAGNTIEKRVPVRLTPQLPTNPVRAVHVSADAWANDELRGGILQLIDAEDASMLSSST